MTNPTRKIFIFLTVAISYTGTASASDDIALRKEYDELRQTVQQLNAKLESLESKLAEVEQNAPLAEPPQPSLDIAYSGDSIYHLSGYTDAGFYGAEGGDGSFATGHFAPILHYQYKDLVLFEGELA
ncbi:MAG: hypothetical protein DRI46_12465, partial [Chloroflexi bacterium]